MDPVNLTPIPPLSQSLRMTRHARLDLLERAAMKGGSWVSTKLGEGVSGPSYQE